MEEREVAFWYDMKRVTRGKGTRIMRRGDGRSGTKTLNKNRGGIMVLTAEEPEDLWHIYNILEKVHDFSLGSLNAFSFTSYRYFIFHDR